MTVRFVGKGGNDSNNGLTWATRKLTLAGAEASPVTPGDTVFVGPGTYRETLTVNVSGTLGNPISYIGDYLGTNTDGIGGLVRITGSNNDTTATRASCVVSSGKSYRTFRGFQMDMTSGIIMDLTSPQNWIIDKCYFDGSFSSSTIPIVIGGQSQKSCTVSNCYVIPQRGGAGLQFNANPVLRDGNHEVYNCLFTGFGTTLTAGLNSGRVGAVSVKNCLFTRLDVGITVNSALPTGTSQSLVVNNCIIDSCRTGLSATVAGEIDENCNNFWNCATNRSNTNTGASSISIYPLYDSRWFFQTVNVGAGPYNPLQMVTPFDLSTQSTLINASGTNPSTVDIRGTAANSLDSRTYGILQIDPTLSIKARQGGMIDGGMILS